MKKRRFITISIITLFITLFYKSCMTAHKPIQTASSVDLESFMGSWFVIGYTPILVDKKAHNPVEHYYLAEDGRIQTTYQYRDGSFDGELKTFKPTGFVHNKTSNAEWRMQFIWPFKAKYFISYLSEDGQNTIITHPNRKYAWIMSRSPEMEQTTYEKLEQMLLDMGFESGILTKAPQNWSFEPDRWKNT